MKATLVYGLGQTGQSVLRFLPKATNIIAFDTRCDQERLALKAQFPHVRFYLNEVVPSENIEQIILSPGLGFDTFLQQAKGCSIPIIGDVELFLRHNTKPIVAVTGSNGKSTVVSMLHHVMRQCGVRSILVGNIGYPALDALNTDYELAILELSSFQLESTYSLHDHIAVITNITPDHLDRHADFEEYCAAKQRIYPGAKHAICHADFVESYPDVAVSTHYFAQHKLDNGAYIDSTCQELVLTASNTRVALSQLPAEQYLDNILCVLLIAEQLAMPLSECVNVLHGFKGLSHRLEKVANINGVEWYNDSKDTNVGAAIAALSRFEDSANTIVLLGGDAKEQSFRDLAGPLQDAKYIIVYGADAAKIIHDLPVNFPIIKANTLQDAVENAFKVAISGNRILLTPACASFDQFNNYVERGECFAKLVKQYSGKDNETDSKK